MRVITLSATLLSIALLISCHDPAEPSLDRCIASESKQEWKAAVAACEDAVQQSSVSNAGRLATGKLSVLREKVAALDAWEDQQRAAQQREAERIEEKQKREADSSATAIRREAKPLSPVQQRKLLLRVTAEARSLIASCSPPRLRGLSRSCIEGLRASFATLDRLGKEADEAQGAGSFDLGYALSLGKNCCNCLESDERYCSEVDDHLRAAARKFNLPEE